jgi:hypothetical protein
MTEEEINQAISTHCGWQYDAHNGKVSYPELGGIFVDLTNDLNAMHEAEEHLSVDEEYDYGEELRKVSENVGPKGGHFTPNGWGCFSLVHLTAKQKAEAYVRVISLPKTKAA